MRTWSLVSLVVFGLSLPRGGRAQSDALDRMLPPRPTTLVADEARLLDSTTKSRVVRIIELLRRDANYEVAILTLPTTGSYQAEQVVTRAIQNWGLGGVTNQGGIFVIVPPQDGRPNSGQFSINMTRGMFRRLSPSAHQAVSRAMISKLQAGDAAAGVLLGIEIAADSLVPGARARWNDEAAREEAKAGQLVTFKAKYGVQVMPSPLELEANPFNFEGKVVALPVQFAQMSTPTTGTFEATVVQGFDLHTVVITVSQIPRGTFKGGERVLLAGKVLGKLVDKTPLGDRSTTSLAFVGFQLCPDVECSAVGDASRPAKDDEPTTTRGAPPSMVADGKPAASWMEGATPEQVVNTVYMLANLGKYEEFAGSIHPKTLEAKLDREQLASNLEGLTRKGTIERMEILSEKINGDSAEVYWQMHFPGSRLRRGRDLLVKNGDNWMLWDGAFLSGAK